jgi:hypothetical protein
MFTPGPTQQTPYIWEDGDYVGLVIRITVNFNNSTRALQNAVVHRDDGCQYHTIVFDNPTDAVKAKRLAAPADGAGDKTYTANQMKAQGLNTIEDVMAVQMTAEF